MGGWGKIHMAVRAGFRPDPIHCNDFMRLIANAVRPGDRIMGYISEVPQHFAAEIIAVNFMKGNCDSVLFIDDDMCFDADDLGELRDDTEGTVYDVLQALCLSRNPPHRPIIPIEEKDEDGNTVYRFPRTQDVQKDAVIETAYCGLGFTLIKRHVFEKIARRKPDEELFFQWGAGGDSEDSMFCQMAKKVGCRIAVSSKVCIGHRVPIVVRWDKESGGVEYEERDRGYNKIIKGIKQKARVKHERIRNTSSDPETIV